MLTKINAFIDSIFNSPSEIQENKKQDLLDKLDVEYKLEHLADSLRDIMDQGGSNVLSQMLSKLNGLLALRLTGEHLIYIDNIPIKLSFNRFGGLESIESTKALPNKQSKHLKPALKKRNLP